MAFLSGSRVASVALTSSKVGGTEYCRGLPMMRIPERLLTIRLNLTSTSTTI